MNDEYCDQLEERVEKQESMISELEYENEELNKHIDTLVLENNNLTHRLDGKRKEKREKSLKLIPFGILGFWVVAIIVSLFF